MKINMWNLCPHLKFYLGIYLRNSLSHFTCSFPFLLMKLSVALRALGYRCTTRQSTPTILEIPSFTFREGNIITSKLKSHKKVRKTSYVKAINGSNWKWATWFSLSKQAMWYIIQWLKNVSCIPEPFWILEF